MFNQLRVLLNNELFITEDNYDYLSYFQTEFTANQSAKDSYLKASLYYKDTPNQQDTLGVDNTGFEKRRGKFALSRSVEIITKVHSELFFQEKLLMNNDLGLTFDIVNSKKCLKSPENTEYNLVLEKAKKQRRTSLANDIDLLNQEKLAITNALYPIPRCQVKTFSIAQGLTNKEINDFQKGDVPSRIFFGLVKGTAYSGTSNENPLKLHHYNISSIDITLSGKSTFG